MIRFFQSSVPVSDYFLSDNWSLLCILTVSKPIPPTKSISQRKFKAIDLQALCDEMSTTITMPGVLTRWTTLWNATFQLWLLSFIVKPYYWPRNLQSDLLWLGSIMTLRKNVGRDRKRKWDGVVLVALLILRTFKGRKITQRICWPRHVVRFSRTILIGTVLIRKIYSWLQKRVLKQDHEVPFPLFKDKLTFANQMGSFVV